MSFRALGIPRGIVGVAILAVLYRLSLLQNTTSLQTHAPRAAVIALGPADAMMHRRALLADDRAGVPWIDDLVVAAYLAQVSSEEITATYI